MMLAGLSLRLRVFLFFAALGLGLIAALVLGLGLAYRRDPGPELLNTLVQGGVIAGFVALGLVAAVWYLFDTNVARPIDLMAGALRARAHADVAQELDARPARYLGDLAPAATAATLTLAETRNALAEAVARETTRLATEKSRLEALLSDVPVGVLLCSGDHQLVFYNGTAVDLIGAAGAAPGLDRKLFDYLRAGPVRHAHTRLIGAGDAEAASDLLCSTLSGGQMLSARMRLVPGDGNGVPGYVLTLRDVTADLAAHAKREALLADILDRVRRPAANLSMLLDALPGVEAAPDLERALRDEAAALARAVVDLGARQDEGRHDGWPLAITRVSDLVDGLRARLDAAGIAISAQEAPLLLRCNGFDVVALLAFCAGQVQAAGLTEEGSFALTIHEEGRDAELRLSWRGRALGVGLLERWLTEPLDPDMPGVTGQVVLANHATEIWPETQAQADAAPDCHSLCLPVRTARREGPRPAPIARAVVYDFDLLGKARDAAVEETRLEDLTYVVFDTETTGLLPEQGDEVVQIAAVRIVNGRRLRGEVFDMLVDPGRAIPAASTAVHGITQAMVAGAPDIGEAGRAFHKFAEGAVLIAHNAPFDMAFLRKHEAAIGLRFDHPVLDTVLLSAVVFGQHEVHSLDALAHRLGLTIPEEVRHTALGDAVATADAFLKLMPMLQGQGFARFGDVLAQVRRHGRLLKDLN